MLNSSTPATGCLNSNTSQSRTLRDAVLCLQVPKGWEVARPDRGPAPCALLRGWKAAPGHHRRRSGGRRRQPSPSLQLVTCYPPLSARVPGHRLGLPAARLRSEDAAGSFLGFPDGERARRCRSLSSVPQSENMRLRGAPSGLTRRLICHGRHSRLRSRHGGARAGQGGNSQGPSLPVRDAPAPG